MSKTNYAPTRKSKVKKVLAAAKGFWGERSRRYRRAKEALKRAMAYSYRDRKKRKGNFRRLWILRINAAARARGLTYRRFINGLKKARIGLSRNILAELAATEAQAFDKLVEVAKDEVK
ncbi:MAG: 50S ribosomal protein L20 [Candidatus Omnitrophica bacterium]|nr:50S ribosomal protein L20 [Candidatus Omnitrophota bacterium]